MPLAVTHIILAIIAIELFRQYVIKDNKKFPRHYVFIAAIAGILPDIDIAAYYILYFFGFTINQVHHTIMHTIFIPIIFFFIGLFIYKTGIKLNSFRKRHIKLSITFYILAVGSILHLILDTILNTTAPLYPFIRTEIGFDIINFFPQDLALWTIFPVIDGLILLFWITWMEFKLKTDDYF